MRPIEKRKKRRYRKTWDQRERDAHDLARRAASYDQVRHRVVRWGPAVLGPGLGLVDGRLTPAQRLVLSVLGAAVGAGFAGMYLSNARVAKLAGVSASTARRSLDRLEELGLVTRTEIYVSCNPYHRAGRTYTRRRRPNVYTAAGPARALYARRSSPVLHTPPKGASDRDLSDSERAAPPSAGGGGALSEVPGPLLKPPAPAEVREWRRDDGLTGEGASAKPRPAGQSTVTLPAHAPPEFVALLERHGVTVRPRSS